MTEYEKAYRECLVWLAPQELLKEYRSMWFPWRYRERKWIIEEIEGRCTY